MNEVFLPMTKVEIGEFVDLSPAVVTRTFKKLVSSGLIETRDRQHVKVKDRAAFGRLVASAERAD